MTDTRPKPRPDAAELLHRVFHEALAHGNHGAAVDAAAALAEMERGRPITVNVTTPPTASIGAEVERARPTHPDAIDLQFQLGDGAEQCWSGMPAQRRLDFIRELSRGARRMSRETWQKRRLVGGGRSMSLDPYVAMQSRLKEQRSAPLLRNMAA